MDVDDHPNFEDVDVQVDAAQGHLLQDLSPVDEQVGSDHGHLLQDLRPADDPVDGALALPAALPALTCG